MTKTRLALDHLDQFASADLDDYTVQNLVEHLKGLSGWWLSEPALERVKDLNDPTLNRLIQNDTPQLSQQLGSCWVSLVVKGNYPLLKETVVLPLRWKKGETDSPLLPESLCRLAKKIRRQISESREFPNYESAKDYGLDFAHAGFPALADDLFQTFESGWGSLTVGLLAILQGLKPDPTVWGSMAWVDDQGVSAVEGIEAKMKSAAQWGAKKFAVALAQYNLAKTVADQYGLEPIPCASSLPLRLVPSVRSYLSAYTQCPEPVVPGDEQSFQKCRNYFFNLPAFSEQLESFRHSHLKEEIIRRCREKLSRTQPNRKWTHLVSLVSHSSVLQELIVKVIQPERCLFFYSPEPDRGNKIRGSVQKFQELFPQAEFAEFENTNEAMKKTFRPRIAKFASGVDPSQVLIEIKSGTAAMKYWLGRAARPGNWIFNLEAKMLENRENDPGSETPEVWQIEEN